jgi:hypothetical protein
MLRSLNFKSLVDEGLSSRIRGQVNTILAGMLFIT